MIMIMIMIMIMKIITHTITLIKGTVKVSGIGGGKNE